MPSLQFPICITAQVKFLLETKLTIPVVSPRENNDAEDIHQIQPPRLSQPMLLTDLPSAQNTTAGLGPGSIRYTTP